MGSKCGCKCASCRRCQGYQGTGPLAWLWRWWFYCPEADLKVPAKPRPHTPVFDENSEFLSVKEWDLRVETNAEKHHTHQYQLAQAGTRLVVRRGQEFSITLVTNRQYDAEKDKISLVFTFAGVKNASFGSGALVGVGVGLGGDGPHCWSASVTESSDKSVTLTVQSSCSALVGEWEVAADISSADTTHSYPCHSAFFLLFNPWCQDDSVYLEGEAERQEYVLSDSGLIWRGTCTRLRPCPWNFAQFEEGVLECVLEVLASVCRMSPGNRGDAVKVCRAISAGVNSPDDDGVLVGNWSGDYSGGSSPTKWGGSQLILQEFYKTKKPVKYGQCWVFSGVVTSCCRALGIPARSITNFSSAHDTHCSLTIDYFFDEDGTVIERLNSDSVWNFHVWNEVWMTREDLGPEYSGWQCIDATPQEESDGQYRCGPASLVAIKNGEIKRPYDIPFIFAEVNADKLFWKYRGPCQPMKLLGRKTGGIGQFVSTKAVGKYAREDVTHLYKYEDDSTKERDVMSKALRMCENTFARYYLNEEFEDVEFDFQMQDDIVIGQPFTSSVTVQNKSGTEYSVMVTLRADTMLYTGTVKDLVKTHKQCLNLKPYAKDVVVLEVSFNEYYPKLLDQCAFNLSCLAKVEQTEFEYFAQDDFRCRKPDIKVEHEGEFVVGREVTCTASFTNPLPMDLTRGRFLVQGAGLTRVVQIIRVKKVVPAEGVASCQFTLHPEVAGERTLNIMFDSRQLEDVDGMLVVTVAKASSTPAPETNGTDADGEVTREEAVPTEAPAPKKEGEEEVAA